MFPGPPAPSARRFLSLGALLLPFAGCAEPAEPPPEPSAAREIGVPPDGDASDGRPALIAFGDSLTAGYGLEVSEAWPARLQELLDAGGFALRVVNAGVSGETTSGGLRRLPWVLDREPDAALLVIALGGNDGLRGVPVRVVEDNLRDMVEEAKGRGLGVLLAGVPAPPELGPDYEEAFERTFRTVAAETGTPLLESLLDGVAGVSGRNQADGIHPNAEGQRLLAESVFEALRAPLAEHPGS